MHLEHGPLPLGGDRRRGKGCVGGGAAHVAGDVHWLGDQDAGLGHGRLQPGELPQRISVAARLGTRGDRASCATALWPRPNGWRGGFLTPQPISTDSCRNCSAGSTAVSSMGRCRTPRRAPHRPGQLRRPSSLPVSCCASIRTSPAGVVHLAPILAEDKGDFRAETSGWATPGSPSRAQGTEGNIEGLSAGHEAAEGAAAAP